MTKNGVARCISRVAVVLATLSLTACSSTGRSFDTKALAQFVPGQTTFADAVKFFGAEPVNTYSQLNGTMVARWAHKYSVLTDALYFREEVMLRFDPSGRFERVVDSVNMLSAPGVPNPPAADRVINEPTMPTAQPEVEYIEIKHPSDKSAAVKPAAEKAPANGKPAPAASVPAPSPAVPMPVPSPTPAAPTVAPVSPPPQPPSELEQPLTNPKVTYPVPSGRNS